MNEDLVRARPDWFVDPAGGDLHPRTAIAAKLGQRAPAADCVDTLDGLPRGAASFAGAASPR